MTRQPASQNDFVEIKDAFARPGTTCTVVAALGSQGMAKFPTWVDVTVPPFAHVMERGFVAGCKFVSKCFDCSMTKCPVVRESLIAKSALLMAVALAAISISMGGIIEEGDGREQLLATIVMSSS